MGVLMQNREIQVICYEVVEAGRCVCLTLTHKGCRFKLINIHAVTEKNGRLALIDKVKFCLQGQLPVIIAGHLNCILMNPEPEHMSRGLM